MRLKTHAFWAVAVCIVVAVAAVPAIAAGPAGDNVPGWKLGLFCGTSDNGATCTKDIAQDTPFYFLHYNFNGGDMTMSELQSSQFNVWQDGMQLKGQVWQQFDSTTKPPTLVGKGNLYTFRNGLPAGTYVFRWELTWTTAAGPQIFWGTTTLVAQQCTTTKIRCGDTT
jgi:hypothetical protein